MGSFFTNVQVYAGDRPAHDLRSAIITAIRRLVLDDGFVEVAPDDATAERMLVIGPADATRWIAVYDSATEGQDETQLDALAAALSTASEGAAVSVLVHDSDVLELRLWHSGARLDSYSSRPDYYGPVSRKQHALLAGQPDRWLDLLADGVTPADLRSTWDEPLLFAEETLARIAELLGMDAARCGTGLRSLLRDGDDDMTPNLDAAGFRRLAFRSTRPATMVAQPSPPAGLPALRLESGVTSVECSVGDALPWAMCAAANAGGPGVGLQIIVWGGALEQGLIALDTIQISMPPADEQAEAIWITHTPAIRQADGIQLRVVHLADYPLLGDTSGWGDALSAGAWQGTHQALSARMLRHIGVRLHGSAGAVGQGELHIGFVPLENPHDGQATWTFTVDVARRARRPLRYAADSPGADRCLRDLDETRVLIAVVALDANRATSARLAADAIAHWNAAIAPDSRGRYECFVHERFNYRPRSLRVAVRAIPDGAPWQAASQMMATCVSLSGALQPPGKRDHDQPPSYRSGFLFEADSLFFQHSGDSAAPQLVLGWNTDGHDDATISRVSDALVGIVDDLMLRGSGLQAFIARWKWPPFYHGSAQSTPYELACGIHGQCTTGRAWCGRWLRAATERLWLGSKLLARLPDPEALRPFADVTQVGDGVRMVLWPSMSLDDLEQALAPILPESSDWKRGIHMLYDRDCKSSDEEVS